MDVIEVDAFLADSVDSVNGKVYALGAGWDSIVALQLPARHPRVGLAILVRVPYTATNQEHRVEVSLRDTDSHLIDLADNPLNPDEKVDKLGATFNVGRPPHLTPGDAQIVPMAMNIDGITFEHSGAYSFVIEVDGSEVKRLPLRVLGQPRFTPTAG